MNPAPTGDRWRLLSVWGVAAALMLSGCSCNGPAGGGPDDAGNAGDGGRPGAVRPADSSARFVDRAAGSGAVFTYRNGQEAEHYAIVESLGGGIGLFDYDRDGDLDLICPGGGRFGPGDTLHGRPVGLFASVGRWRFEDAAEQAGIDAERFYSHGAAVGDYDGDGFPDVLITGYGGLVLWHNEGDGTFREATVDAGLGDHRWSSSAAWGDVNGDGVLDVYVAHYVAWGFKSGPDPLRPLKNPPCMAKSGDQRDICPPRSFDPLPDTLYLGRGDGTFEDVSSDAGLVFSGACGKGLGVLLSDIDLDGDLDIYVCNDTVANFLYRNDGSGRFREVALQSGAAVSETGVPEGSMGVDLGDYNLDGRLDLWVTNYERESIALYRNDGNCLFQHVSHITGITTVGGLYVGWGTVFFDFDFDGDEDVFVSNGHVIRHPSEATVNQPALLFENRRDDDRGSRRFVNVAPGAGAYLDQPHMGRGVALGDLDNDGDLDLAVCHINQPVALLENRSPPDDHHWLGVRLVGTRGGTHRDAVGAIVRVETATGDVQVRQVKSGSSYASSSSPVLVFGLGTAEVVRRIEVRWPAGHRQQLADVAIDRAHVIREPAVEGSSGK